MDTIDMTIKGSTSIVEAYKIIRKYTSTPISVIKKKIEQQDIILSVNDLDLEEIKKFRGVIKELNDTGTEVTLRDITGDISLEVLDNIIESYEGIAKDTERLDELMFGDE